MRGAVFNSNGIALSVASVLKSYLDFSYNIASPPCVFKWQIELTLFKKHHKHPSIIRISRNIYCFQRGNVPAALIWLEESTLHDNVIAKAASASYGL